MAAPNVDLAENRRRMKAGELYYAFTPDLTADRKRCRLACERFNAAGDVSRQQLVEFYRDIVNDKKPLPPRSPAASQEQYETLLEDYPWIEAPVKMDYGYNVKCVDIFIVSLIGPNCSFFAGTHPLDPAIRNGTRGPEAGKPITIGEDCWLGGNCIILPGVTIGNGATVGAGSTVTKNVPPYTVVVGNPARVLKKVEVSDKQAGGAEVLAGENVPKV